MHDASTHQATLKLPKIQLWDAFPLGLPVSTPRLRLALPLTLPSSSGILTPSILPSIQFIIAARERSRRPALSRRSRIVFNSFQPYDSSVGQTSKSADLH